MSLNILMKMKARTGTVGRRMFTFSKSAILGLLVSGAVALFGCSSTAYSEQPLHAHGVPSSQAQEIPLQTLTTSTGLRLELLVVPRLKNAVDNALVLRHEMADGSHQMKELNPGSLRELVGVSLDAPVLISELIDGKSDRYFPGESLPCESTAMGERDSITNDAGLDFNQMPTHWIQLVGVFAPAQAQSGDAEERSNTPWRKPGFKPRFKSREQTLIIDVCITGDEVTVTPTSLRQQQRHSIRLGNSVLGSPGFAHNITSQEMLDGFLAANARFPRDLQIDFSKQRLIVVSQRLNSGSITLFMPKVRVSKEAYELSWLHYSPSIVTKDVKTSMIWAIVPADGRPARYGANPSLPVCSECVVGVADRVRHRWTRIEGQPPRRPGTGQLE